MKRFNSSNGTSGHRPQQQRQYQQNYQSSKFGTQERWGSQERFSEGGDSQTLTQQSSQRTQPMTSSSPINHFDTIIATQRHAEVMTYLKQFSRVFSETNNQQSTAIADCIGHLQSISKSVAGFSADARRLESSSREQLTALEKELMSVKKKIEDINGLIRDERTDADRARKDVYRYPDQSFSSSLLETEDGICVTDYLIEVQQRRLRTSGILVSAASTSSEYAVYECDETEMSDDLFSEDPTAVCAPSVKKSGGNHDKLVIQRQPDSRCTTVCDKLSTDCSVQKRGQLLTHSNHCRQSSQTSETALRVAVDGDMLASGGLKTTNLGGGSNEIIYESERRFERGQSFKGNISETQKSVRDDHRNFSSSEKQNHVVAEGHCLNDRTKFQEGAQYTKQSIAMQNLKSRSSKPESSVGCTDFPATLKRKKSSEDIYYHTSRDSYMTQPINFNY